MKRRMCVSRCCCQSGLCSSSPHKASFSDGFGDGVIDSEWSVTGNATGSESGGVLHLDKATVSFSSSGDIRTSFTFDSGLYNTLTIEVTTVDFLSADGSSVAQFGAIDLILGGTSTKAGIGCVGYGSNVPGGSSTAEYFTRDHTGIGTLRGVNWAANDVLLMELDFSGVTSANFNTLQSIPIVYKVNGSTIHSGNTTINPSTMCNDAVKIIIGSSANDTLLSEWDDFSWTPS